MMKPILLSIMLFFFEKGGKYALTGPSGCGKSTLLKLILGWLPDYDGSIALRREVMADKNQGQLRIAQEAFFHNPGIFFVQGAGAFVQLPDYDGSIRFDGRDATDYTPEQLQKQMSYIAQDVFLFNTYLFWAETGSR